MLLVAVLVGAFAIAAGAVGHRAGHRTGAARLVELRGLERSALVARTSAVVAALPRERNGRCVRSVVIRGQGAACRTAQGLLRLPLPGGASTTTHGPDPRPLAPASGAPAAARVGRLLEPPYGAQADAICGQAERGRTFLLVHMLPKDFLSSTSAVRTAPGRAATLRDQLRQAAYDASHHVDLRAKELTGNAQRRRMRFVCDPDGLPTVRRVVLPHTASTYMSATGAVVDGTRQVGFALMLADLTKLGVRATFPVRFGGAAKQAGQYKVIAYYDGQYEEGVGGQGETIPLSQQGLTGTSWASRTALGIHNNQMEAMTAIQYGTAYDEFGAASAVGTPDPPSFTTILHEATHTMGAVQDGAPQSSNEGHCNDGLDIMCYADNPDSTYVNTVCPDAGGGLTSQDEVYDCNGNTYFNPVPTGWLSTHWNLGEPMNEFLARERVANPAPVAPAKLTATGPGTDVTLRATALPAENGLQYVVWRRKVPGAFTRVSVSDRPRIIMDGLQPSTNYEFAVAGADRAGNQGIAAVATLKTGRDSTPPSRPRLFLVQGRQQRAVTLRWGRSRDNVAVRGYRIDRLVGGTWRVAKTVRGAGSATTVSPWIRGLSRRTAYRFRIRAYDARGNYSAGVATSARTT